MWFVTDDTLHGFAIAFARDATIWLVYKIQWTTIGLVRFY
jgi:hypothetical protein